MGLQEQLFFVFNSDKTQNYVYGHILFLTNLNLFIRISLIKTTKFLYSSSSWLTY